jgi:hypothetical protein
MFARRSVLLALAGSLAAVACKDVSQRDPAPVLALAAFDPALPIVPFPNDLILQAAPGVTDPTRRAGLFQLIDLGGWPPDLTSDAWRPAAGAPPGIYVFVHAQAFDPSSNTYTPAAPPATIDMDTVNAQTVAIVKLDTTPATLIAPAVATYVPATPIPGIAAIYILPVTETPNILPPGRYVVAVRGGPNGVHFVAADDVTRIPLEADLPIALVAPNKDLSQEQNQPPGGLSTDQVTTLERLRATFDVAMDWGRVNIAAVCLAALGGIPPEALPENRCWLPPFPAPPLEQPLPSPGITAAFAAVDMVFPHEEIASIQTFEVFVPPEMLQEEVAP